MKRKLFVFLAVLAANASLFGQDDTGELPTKQRVLPVTIRFSGGLDFIAKPTAMKNNFNSVGDATLGVVFGLGAGINIGPTMRYTAFQVRQNASNFNETVVENGVAISKPISTTYTSYAPGILLSYDRWVSPYSLFSFSVNPSYGYVKYSKLRNNVPDSVVNKFSKADYNHKALMIEPAITFHYFFEDRVAMSIRVGYTRTWSEFQPERVRLDGGAISYLTSEIDGPIQFFTVGLGFVYSFRRVD